MMTTEIKIAPGQQLLAQEGPAQGTKTAYDAVKAYLYRLGNQRSRKVMYGTLDIIAMKYMGGAGYRVDTAPWNKLDRSAVSMIKARLQMAYKSVKTGHELLIPDVAQMDDPKEWSPKYTQRTINRYLSAIRGVTKEAMLLDQMSTADYEKIKSIPIHKSYRVPAGRALSYEEADKLLSACDNDERIQGVRDKAILALLFGTGMRRSEIVSLKYEDLNWNDHSFLIQGKGDKERYVDMTKRAWQMLAHWIDVRGTQHGPVFTRIRVGNMMTDEGLSSDAVYYLTKQIQRKAGLENIRPHDLRRSFITWALDEGMDISLVGEMVGHSDIQTTSMYDQRGRKKRREKLHKMKF